MEEYARDEGRRSTSRLYLCVYFQRLQSVGIVLFMSKNKKNDGIQNQYSLL